MLTHERDLIILFSFFLSNFGFLFAVKALWKIRVAREPCYPIF